MIDLSQFNIAVAVIASITLFLYGLQSFTREIQTLTSGPLKETLSRATRNRIVASGIGAASTALIQSSSAVSSIIVALVDAGLIPLRNALALMVGANVGTASTAFLVSAKLEGIGGLFIFIGAAMSLLPIKGRLLGKSIFYFGFILFSLDQLNFSFGPIYKDESLLWALQLTENRLFGLLVGAALTAVVQSSSVITGLAVLLTAEGSLTLPGAIAIVLGANVGTTSTALFASMTLGPLARLTALANCIFNLAGAAVALFLLPSLVALASRWSNGSTGFAVALSHLVFNVGMALLVLPFLTPVQRVISELHFQRKRETTV